MTKRTNRPRRRLTADEREAMQQEALSRAQGGMTLRNYETIIREFSARGIPLDDIHPRENVLTYHAWRALGRQVRRGEHGVSVLTFIQPAETETPEGDDRKKTRHGSRPWSARVFHISQTDPIAAPVTA